MYMPDKSVHWYRGNDGTPVSSTRRFFKKDRRLQYAKAPGAAGGSSSHGPRMTTNDINRKKWKAFTEAPAPRRVGRFTVTLT